MSNTRRPTLVRKVTKTTEKERKAALDEGYRMTIDGESYEVRNGDITPRIARELRANTGVAWWGLQESLARDPDIDLISTFVWLARRIRGEQVDLDDVEVTYRSMLSDDFDLDYAGAPKEDGSPEA